MNFRELEEISLAWAETSEFLSKIREAKKIIESALKLPGKKYIAFSGGKDSTALLHLVLKYDKNIMVHHHDLNHKGVMPVSFEKEIKRMAFKIGCEKYKVTNRPFYFANKAYYDSGFRIAFIGLRKEESSNRKQRILAGRSLNEIKEIWPLQNWSWRDVWAYIFINNLPIHSVYKIYGEIIGWDQVRFHSFFDKDFDKFGASNIDGMLLWKLKNKKGKKNI